MDVEKIQRGLFKNDSLENKLLEYGFLKVPFFTSSELEQVKCFYQNVHPDSKMNLEGTENGIHMTTWSGSTEYKKLVASFDVKNIFDKPVYDNLSVQKPGRAFYLKLNYTINNF